MLMRSEDIVSFQMAIQMASQNMLHYFTRDVCQSDQPAVFWRGFIIFLVYRGDDCHFPFAKQVTRFIRLSKDHHFVRIVKRRFTVPMGIFVRARQLYWACFSNPGVFIISSSIAGWTDWGTASQGDWLVIRFRHLIVFHKRSAGPASFPDLNTLDKRTETGRHGDWRRGCSQPTIWQNLFWRHWFRTNGHHERTCHSW